MRNPHPTVTALVEALLPHEELERIRNLPLRDEGFGYDPYGMERDHIALGIALTRPLYEKYFRVISSGAEKVPGSGPAILAANHSGTLPFDGAMLWADVVRKVHRVPRPVADFFVSNLPFVSTLFTRGGVVGGARGNVRSLLEAGELMMIFPEGVPGIGKPFSERYQLQEWRVGHAELAIRHRAPVVPVAIIGAEEQMPQLGRLRRLGRLFGAPYVPLTLTPLPLPVRYHIHYGAPIPLHEDYRPGDADDPELVKEAARRVRDAVEELIEKGLRERKSVFA
ncbi:lysophospholipid acyltransferase family protein [Vulgatibacter sp.]|uniref:lysophospholipid acyltransferase family protein n=1 Tax=Vulgatibacter sp. TaxID=1971226 RepID=UPI003568EEAB